MSQEFWKTCVLLQFSQAITSYNHFSLFLRSQPMSYSPLRVSGKPFVVKLTGESFRFGIFLIFHGFQFCYTVSQWQISSTEIYLSLLLVTFAPKSFWIFFYIPKVILKLHLDGKLQVTLAYYLYYKRDFSYCQTLWLLKCQTIYTDFENNYMLWSNPQCQPGCWFRLANQKPTIFPPRPPSPQVPKKWTSPIQAVKNAR